MAWRPRLRGGFRPWLPDHRLADGRLYARYLRAGLELLGRKTLPYDAELLHLEVERYAKAALLHDQATRHWAALLTKRETGKGRRPNERRIERAARRVGLADLTLKDCMARLEALAQRNGHGDPLDQILAELYAERRAGRA
jgi:hypothetical protein